MGDTANPSTTQGVEQVSNYNVGRNLGNTQNQDEITSMMGKAMQQVMAAPARVPDRALPSPTDLNPNYGQSINVGTTSTPIGSSPIFVERGGKFPLALLDREFQYQRDEENARQAAKADEYKKLTTAANAQKEEFITMNFKNHELALNEKLHNETMSTYDGYFNHLRSVGDPNAASKAKLALKNDWGYQYKLQKFKSVAEGMDDVLTKATDILASKPLGAKEAGNETSGTYIPDALRNLASKIMMAPANGQYDIDKMSTDMAAFNKMVGVNDAASDIGKSLSKEVVGKMRQIASTMEEKLYETNYETNSNAVINEYMPKMKEQLMFNYKSEGTIVSDWGAFTASVGSKEVKGLTEEGMSILNMGQDIIKTNIKHSLTRHSDKLKSEEYDLAKSGVTFNNGKIVLPGGSRIITDATGQTKYMETRNVIGFNPKASPITVQGMTGGDKRKAVYSQDLGKWIIIKQAFDFHVNTQEDMNVNELYGDNQWAKEQYGPVQKLGTPGDKLDQSMLVGYIRGESKTSVSNTYSPGEAQTIDGKVYNMGTGGVIQQGENGSKYTYPTTRETAPADTEISYQVLNNDGTVSEDRKYSLKAGQAMVLYTASSPVVTQQLAADPANEDYRKLVGVAANKGISIMKGAGGSEADKPTKSIDNSTTTTTESTKGSSGGRSYKTLTITKK